MYFHKFQYNFHKFCDSRFSPSKIAMGTAKWLDRKAHNPQPNVLTTRLRDHVSQRINSLTLTIRGAFKKYAEFSPPPCGRGIE